jgi:hypothetical protein
MLAKLLLLFVLLFGLDSVQAFLSALTTTSTTTGSPRWKVSQQQLPSHHAFRFDRRSMRLPAGLALSDKRWDQEIEENSRRKAQGGMGETAAGAVLGGLLLGPFGA